MIEKHILYDKYSDTRKKPEYALNISSRTQNIFNDNEKQRIFDDFSSIINDVKIYYNNGGISAYILTQPLDIETNEIEEQPKGFLNKINKYRNKNQPKTIGKIDEVFGIDFRNTPTKVITQQTEAGNIYEILINVSDESYNKLKEKKNKRTNANLDTLLRYYPPQPKFKPIENNTSKQSEYKYIAESLEPIFSLLEKLGVPEGYGVLHTAKRRVENDQIPYETKNINPDPIFEHKNSKFYEIQREDPKLPDYYNIIKAMVDEDGEIPDKKFLDSLCPGLGDKFFNDFPKEKGKKRMKVVSDKEVNKFKQEITKKLDKQKTENTNKITLEDVVGNEEAKNELKKVLEYFKDPEEFEKWGIGQKAGVVLHGPPGTGKTLMAKGIANDADAHFILVKAQDIYDKYVGESEKNLEEIFKEANEYERSIIFIDEFDQIAHRDDDSNRVQHSLVNILLQKIDGFEKLENVYLITATNKYNLIDSALKDRLHGIKVPLPNYQSRLELVQKTVEKHKENAEIHPFDELNFELIAKESKSLSGRKLVGEGQGIFQKLLYMAKEKTDESGELYKITTQDWLDEINNTKDKPDEKPIGFRTK
ncbi:ATP-binding protein [Nanoarchaeota archaeon]